MSSVEELEEELKGYKQERMNLFKTIEQLQKIIKRKDNGIKALTKDLCEESENKDRLNNNWNELEKWLKDYPDEENAQIILSKLKELRGNSNVEDKR